MKKSKPVFQLQQLDFDALDDKKILFDQIMKHGPRAMASMKFELVEMRGLGLEHELSAGLEVMDVIALDVVAKNQFRKFCHGHARLANATWQLAESNERLALELLGIDTDSLAEQLAKRTASLGTTRPAAFFCHAGAGRPRKAT